jgi:uncharacterized protein
MGVPTSGQRVHLEQRNGAPRSATTTDEDLRRAYEQRVRQLLDALEARLLGLPPEQRFAAAIGAMAAAVEDGRQVTVKVKPFTVRF